MRVARCPEDARRAYRRRTDPPQNSYRCASTLSGKALRRPGFFAVPCQRGIGSATGVGPVRIARAASVINSDNTC